MSDAARDELVQWQRRLGLSNAGLAELLCVDVSSVVRKRGGRQAVRPVDLRILRLYAVAIENTGITSLPNFADST